MSTFLAIDIEGTFTKIGIDADTGGILVSKVFRKNFKKPIRSL